MTDLCKTDADLTTADAFQLQAAVLARHDLGDAAKLLFCCLQCDSGFRQGWIVTKSPGQFVSDLHLGSVEQFRRCIRALANAEVVAARLEVNALSLGLGPWSYRLLQDGCV